MPTGNGVSVSTLHRTTNDHAMSAASAAATARRSRDIMVRETAMPAAVVLLSGGLDSTTALAVARDRGFDCHALTVRYGQLHAVELDAARRVAARAGVRAHRVVDLDLSALAPSALTSRAIAVPKDRPLAEIGSPRRVPPPYRP